MNFPGKTFQSGMVTLFLDEVVKLTFVLLPLDMYLFSGVSDNKNLLRGSNGNVLSITITGNVSVIGQITPLAAMSLLDFIIIQIITNLAKIALQYL